MLLNNSDHLIPIDARTGVVGAPITANDPYNLYFTPDGLSAFVVAEQHSRLDFRDPKTMARQHSIEAPGCRGLNHADSVADRLQGGVHVIDAQHLREIRLIPTGVGAHSVTTQP